MIKIPDEVAEAADAAYYDTAADPRWSDGHLMKTAIAAALNSWPGMQHDNYVIVLPQEASDD